MQTNHGGLTPRRSPKQNVSTEQRAIKVMHYGGHRDRESFLAVLKGSLATIARMRHPNLINIHDAVTTDEYAYVVMDLHNPDRNFRSYTASDAVWRNPRVILDALEQVIEVLA